MTSRTSPNAEVTAALSPISAYTPAFEEDDNAAGAGICCCCGDCCRLDDIFEAALAVLLLSDQSLDDDFNFIADVAAASAATAAVKPLAASSRSAVEPGVSVLETRGTLMSKHLRLDLRVSSAAAGVSVLSPACEGATRCCPWRSGTS